MKPTTIIAKDKAKVELGRRDELQPETWEEFLETFDQADIMKHTWASFVIEVQGELRNAVRSPSKDSETVKLVKKLTPEQQAKVAAYLESLK